MSLKARSGQIYSRARTNPSLLWLFALSVQIETLQELLCGFRMFQRGGSETSELNLPFLSSPKAVFHSAYCCHERARGQNRHFKPLLF